MRRRAMPNLLGDYSKLDERQARLERVLQVIGFSPEMPYTLLVSDSTYNRVSIGLINGDYGIKIVDNSGATIVFADGHITADGITVGTLDADLVNVINIHADEITVGYLSASKIQGGVLDFDYITAHAIRADKITAGKFFDFNDRLFDQAIHGVKVQAGTLDADRIVALSIRAINIKSEAITSDKIFGGAVISSKIQSDLALYGCVIADYIDTPNSLSIGASACGSGLLLGAGKEISWLGGEGDIINVDRIRGYNDLRFYVVGSDKAIWFSTSGGGDLSMFPYWGDFYATGTKYFRIRHPDDPENKFLQYTSVESPEVSLKIRGVAKLNSGEATITLPHHWELVTEDILTTVQLTPCGDCKGLFAPKSSLKNTSFVVKELQGGTSNAEFMWELTCTRKGYSDFDPEQTLEAEAEKIAESLAHSPPDTKREYMKMRADKEAEHRDFQDLIMKKFKEKTGRDYVDKSKIWRAEEMEKEIEAEEKKRAEEVKKRGY